MVAVVVVTHGSLALALLESASLIVGELPATRAVGLAPDDGPESARAKVERAITAVDEGDGTILLVDLPGGTPCTVCVGCLEEFRAEIVSGVNLSMLVKVPFVRANTSSTLAEKAEELAMFGIRAIRVLTGLGCKGGA